MAEQKQCDSGKAGAGSQVPANRLLGVYPQKQDGLFMQRIRIPGGRISWPQWRRIAELAVKYTPGVPLHLTTRQDIELHDVTQESIPAVHEGLAEAALTVFGAGGDSVRNVTVCAGCDLCRDAFDLLPLARLVQSHIEQQPVIFNLGRKFKISFSGCEKACARPWVSDLGFIAQADGLFTVIGAGSLGAKPALGIRFYEDLPAGDILPLCVAALEFFEQSGERQNRRRARFRHVREKFGNQAFLAELDNRFKHLKARQSWPGIVPAAAHGRSKLLHRLQLPNGNISPREAFDLADTAEPKGATLRINLEHGIELYGKKEFELPESPAQLANNPIIIACPGSTTCPRGLVNCWLSADKIRKILTKQHTKQLQICISGCPNNCAQSAVADIGLIGMMRKENGMPTEHYRLFTGGGNGKNEKLAEPSSVISARDVCKTIESLLRNFD
jgi:sulfite reductase beta subunit-like hemoprotein